MAAVVCLVCGCASGGSAPAAKAARDPEPRRHVARAPVKAELVEKREEDEVERQVRALRQAIALYAQFIERAEKQPDMKDAVERSKQRIEDAQATIDFLLEKQPPEQD
jgi:hypothetical protein